MYAATSDQALAKVPPRSRDLIRMDVFKSMLLRLAIHLEEEEKKQEEEK